MSLPEKKFINLKEHRLSYREKGEGQALIFIHGMGGGSGNWKTQYEVFSPRFRVIGWDAPGYGDSDEWGVDIPSTGDYAMLIMSFMDALKIKSAHLVGHSYGAVMVMAFYRSFRDRVLSLTLAEPVAGGGTTSLKERSKSIRARERELDNLGSEGFAELHVPRSCSPNADPEIIKRGIESAKQLNPEGYLTQFRSLRHANIFEWIIRPRIPTMVVGGENDRTAQPSEVDKIFISLPGSEKYIIPDIGHMIYLEYPERFNSLLKNFLTKT